MQLQPPPDSDKAKRIGGKKKIKTRLRNKNFMEKFWWFYWRIGIIATIYWLYILWPLLSSESAKRMWNIDYVILRPFEWIDYVFHFCKEHVVWFIEEFKKGPPNGR